MDFRQLPNLVLILVLLASLRTISALVHNVTKLGINKEVSFPLQSGEVNGRLVTVDSNGERIKLACVNWAPLDAISAKIAEMGFNCVRLVYALDTVFENPVVKPERVSENPQLVGKTVMEIMDHVVESLTAANVMVILNNHMSEAGWCCALDDGNGLWYTDKYPEEMFFEHWAMMAERYAANPMVIGADLRNEVRATKKGENGTVTFALWGSGRAGQDWNKAAEEAGRRVLAANPDMLVIVGGLVSGGFLTPAMWAPIQIPNQEKLVYTGHIYTFTPVIGDLPWPLYDPILTFIQMFVDDAGHPYSAPFWMGEFGTGTEDSENYQKIIRLLTENDADFAYWSVDGYRYPGQEEGYGLLEDDYQTVKVPWKLEQLQELMPILS